MTIALRLVLYFLFLPALFVACFLDYFTPESFDISFKLECGTDQGLQCKTVVESNPLTTFLTSIKSKIEDSSRISQIYQITPDILRFNLELENKSLAPWRVSQPPQMIPMKASLLCNNRVVLYEESLFLELNSKLTEIPTVISEVATSIANCQLKSSEGFEKSGKFLVGPNGVVSFDLKDFQGSYKVRFIPDEKGSRIVFLLFFLAMFPALPVMREGYRFITGKKYFTK